MNAKQLDRRDVLMLGGAALAGSLAGGAEAARAATPAKSQSSNKPRIKIGQIGTGHAHASGVQAAFRESGQYDVVGVVEEDESLRREAQAHPAYEGLRWISREELLNTSGLQGVLVETRVGDLLDTAEACVAAGKHIHLDKPPGESLPQFRRMLDSAAQQKLMVQLGYMFRYNPGIVLLREFLKKGWLGEVFEVHAVISKVLNPDSRKKVGRFKGGMMFELGGHVIDVVVEILGKPEKVTPYIRQVEKIDSWPDNMLAVLEYPRIVATVKSSAVEIEGSGRRHLVVCGTEGTFHIQPLDKPAARISLSKARGKYKAGSQDVKLPPAPRYIGDAIEMARVIRGEKAADYSYTHDLAVQTTLLEACGLPLDK
jgi:predicted dehydrogenase